MKAYCNNDNTWYGYEKLSSLLQKYVPNVQTLMPASTLNGFELQLNKINVDGQYFIPLNINCLSQNFGDSKYGLQNNHWAGLYIVKHNSRITEISYFDPMGRKINPQLFPTITTNFGTLGISIGQPLFNKPIQYAQEKAGILEGNTDDCGPMLVYALSCQVHGLPIAKIYTKTTSNSLGSYLRESFSMDISFEEIYNTVTDIGQDIKTTGKIVSTEQSLTDTQIGGVEEKIILFREEYQHDLNGLNQGYNNDILEDQTIELGELKENTLAMAIKLSHIGNTYAERGKYQEAVKTHEEAVRIQKALLGVNHPTLAISYNNLGMAYNSIKNYEEAHKNLSKALETKRSSGIISVELASAINATGLAYDGLGKFQEALDCYQEALGIHKKLIGLDDLYVADYLDNMGCAYSQLGQHTEALEKHDEALKIRKALLPAEHPSIAISYNNIGSAHAGFKDHQNALKYFQESLKIKKNCLEENHLDTAATYSNIGSVYSQLGSQKQDPHEQLECNKKALDCYLAALKIKRSWFEEEHLEIMTILSHIAVTYGNFGEVYWKLENYQEALGANLQSLELLRKCYGEHPLITAILNSLGSACFKLGKHEEALSCHLQAVKLANEYQEAPSTKIANIISNVGSTCFAMGLYEGALKFEENVLVLRKKFLEEQHPDILASKKNIAIIYERLGKYDMALAELAGALRILNKTDMEAKKLEFKKLITSCIGIKKTFEVVKGLLHSADEAKNAWVKLQSLNKKKVQEYNLIKKKHIDADHNYKNALDLSKEIFNEELTLKCLKGLEIIYTNGNNIITEQKIIQKEIEACTERIEKTKVQDLVNLTQQSNITTLQNNLSKLLNKSEDLPEKAGGSVRLVSYNITADYFDANDTTLDGHHQWKSRVPFVNKLLSAVHPDIICLQELSPNQAVELHKHFGNCLGYSSVFLLQTPSEVKGGAIAYGVAVSDWCGKNTDITLVGTFISKACKFLEAGTFWSNKEPDVMPTNTDVSETDKSCDNIDYRAMLWAKVQIDDSKTLFVFNSHSSLSNNKAYLECATLEMAKIKEITQGANWVSAGGHNIIPVKDDDESYDISIFQELAQYSRNKVSDNKHYGINTTWIGFSCDQYKNELKSGDFTDPLILDAVVSNMEQGCTFFLHGAFNPITQELLPLTGALNDQQNEGRYFASDHALIGTDLFDA